LAHANQVRDWRIYADFAQILITKARLLYANDPFGVELEQSVYALDSTTIDFYARRNYSSKLRRIRYVDPDTQKRLTFLINNFTLPADTVADLYRCRWQVELFFKWLKQHLRIKAFYGTTENAVKTQIWIAITVYVLVAIVKKMLKLDQRL
jgi:IS4 transposase